MSNTAFETSGLMPDALSTRSAGERARAVRAIADLFMKQAGDYSAEQVQLFDQVMMRMIDQIDEEIRVYLSDRLATIDNAPRQTIRHLASDPAIAVAGPVLSQSPCLDEDFLLDSAKSKGQAHLVAISSRKIVSPRITDVLVVRGDDKVARTLASNHGAKLSERGRALMVERAKGNLDLAQVVWNREDIPRQQVLALFEKVSESVRQQFEADAQSKPADIAQAVRLARRKLQEESQQTSIAYANARARIDALKRTGGLSQSHVLSFASQQKFEEVVLAISELSRLTAADTERMLLEKGRERLLVVCKAIGLPWTCVRLIAQMDQRTREPDEITQLCTRYQSMSRESAVKGLQFHQLREKAKNGPPQT